MPLVRIDVDETIPANRRRAIADAIHDALVTSLAMPPQDRFQIITTHPGPDELIFDAQYLGVERHNVVFIQIVMVDMYDRPTKAAMFTAIADALQAAGVRRDDIFATVTENTAEDWYAGVDAAAQP
jgi:phenylpyruvate tautomerase PptA (4-oxalocrotonate tautomerase family)